MLHGFDRAAPNAETGDPAAAACRFAQSPLRK